MTEKKKDNSTMLPDNPDGARSPVRVGLPDGLR